MSLTPTKHRDITQPARTPAHAAKYVLYAQVLFALGMAACTVLMPQFAFSRDQGGVSNYGVHSRTVAAFTVAFWGCGLLMLKAARALRRDSPERQHSLTADVVGAVGWLILLTAITTYPYKINNFFDELHIWTSVILIVSELAAGTYLWRLGRSAACNWLFGLQLAGFCLTLLTFLGVLHVLFAGEVAAGLGFGLLAVRSLYDNDAIPAH